jgi:hypothetical protein
MSSHGNQQTDVFQTLRFKIQRMLSFREMDTDPKTRCGIGVLVDDFAGQIVAEVETVLEQKRWPVQMRRISRTAHFGIPANIRTDYLREWTTDSAKEQA